MVPQWYGKEWRESKTEVEQRDEKILSWSETVEDCETKHLVEKNVSGIERTAYRCIEKFW